MTNVSLFISFYLFLFSSRIFFFFLFNPFKVFVLPLLDGFLFYPFYFLISSLLFCLFYPVQRLPWELHWALSLLSFLTMAAMAAMIMELSLSPLFSHLSFFPLFYLSLSLTSLSFPTSRGRAMWQRVYPSFALPSKQVIVPTCSPDRKSW